MQPLSCTGLSTTSTDHCPLVHKFVEDLAPCRTAQRIESGFLLAELRQMKQRINVLRQLCEHDDRMLRLIKARDAALSAEPGAPAAVNLSIDVDTSMNLTRQISVGSAASGLSVDSATSQSELDAHVPIPAHVREFLAEATQTVHQLEAQLARVQSTFNSVCSFLLYPETSPWESLFSLLSVFLIEYDEARSELAVQREQRRHKARQLETLQMIQGLQKQKSAVKDKRKSLAAAESADSVVDARMSLKMEKENAHDAEAPQSVQVTPPQAMTEEVKPQSPTITPVVKIEPVEAAKTEPVNNQSTESVAVAANYCCN